MNPAADPLLRRLADYDDALAAGQQPALAAPPEDEGRWAGAVAVVEMLRRMQLTATHAAGRSVEVHETPLPERIGRYLVGRELGRGGMGIVYEAWDPDLGRRVAVKVLQDPDAGGRARFLNEAGSLARLTHPHIVQVFEVGNEAGQPYLVMEYVPGAALRGTPEALLPPRQAAALVAQIARAIHYAHEQGILHRDLKPANILLTPDGVPKVTDFGLAKQLDGDADLTRTGAALGTPAYMAPEQAAGKQRNAPAVDVYGLGATLYALLAGRPPFVGLNAFAVLQQVAQDDPLSPRSANPQVPLDLEVICLKCLEKDPARRYASAAELADDLDRYRAGVPVRARPVSTLERLRRWCVRNRGVATLAAGLFVVLVAGIVATSLLAAWAWRERDEAAEQAEIAQTVRDFLQDDLILQAAPETQERRGFKVDWNLSLRAAVERAETRIGARFAGRPRIEAAIRGSIGRAYVGLHLFDKGVVQLDECLRLLRRARGPDHADLIDPLTHTVTALGMDARPRERLPYQRDLYRLLSLHRPATESEVLRQGMSLGLLEAVVGDPERGGALLDDLHTRAQVAHGALGLITLELKTAVTLLPARAGRADLAARVRADLVAAPLAEVTELAQPEQGPLRLQLTIALTEANRVDRAVLFLTAALDEQRRRAPDAPATLEQTCDLARQLRQWGRAAEAVPYYRATRAAWLRVVPQDNARVLALDADLLECLLLAGDVAAAEELAQALLTARERPGVAALDQGTALVLRGWCHLERKQLGEAELLLDLGQLRFVDLGQDPTLRLWGRSLLGQTLLLGKRYPAAEEHLLAAYAGLRLTTGLQQGYRERTRAALVALYQATGQRDQAQKWRTVIPAAAARSD